MANALHSFASHAPQSILAYFNGEHPTIGQAFTPGKGWTNYPWRKRLSESECRKLRRAGATHVALDADGRRADFELRDLCIRYAWDRKH